ncbi:MAG: FIST C-terminal domain-containing protein [Azonexus sp.]
MQVRFEATGTLAALTQTLHALDAAPEVRGLLLLTCDENGFSAETLDPVLHQLAKPVFGGIFPRIIFGREHFSRGSIVVGLPVRPDIRRIEQLSDPALDIDRAAAALADLRDTQGTLLVFVDGFARRIGDLIGALFDHLGLGINQIGGGTGSLSLRQKPCVISNAGLQQDVALLAQLQIDSSVASGHGWSPISDSIKVTAARQNTILSLNYRPALEVYREIVEAHGGMVPGPENFFAVAKAYPFGIYKLGSEVVVRDPVSVGPDGSLTCVGEVTSGSFVHILHGEAQALIAAAAEAAHRACAGGKTGQLRLFIDCISRVLFLGERFNEELAAVQGAEPLLGVLAIGEICNDGRDYPEFLNKTAVLGLLARQ